MPLFFFKPYNYNLKSMIDHSQNVFAPAEKIGLSLKPWALFVNIFVNEIEQKTILQFKPLKM